MTAPRALALPEMARRIFVHRLGGRVPDWHLGPCSPSKWRDCPTDDEVLGEVPPAEWLRVRAAEALLRDVVATCAGLGYRWPAVARTLGADSGENADPEQDEIDRGLLRRIFEHCCGRDGKRLMSKSSRYPGSNGWVDLTSPSAQEVLAELLPDIPNQDPRHVLNQILMETGWPRALGVDAHLRFNGCVRGATWVGRFEGVGPRGIAPVNEAIQFGEGSV